ncbi:MAG: DUF2079 domain-containing protein [Oligoflexia bacterium]|nr:DUF2079 domain-containing protein [Oligoflexia bacterium]
MYFVIFCGVIFSTYYVQSSPIFFDPDKLFHWALIREMYEHKTLVLREWAQFPILGWDQYFPDKEYFFHLLLYPFIRLFGENHGTLLFIVLIIFGFYFSLHYFFKQKRTQYVAPICFSLLFIHPLIWQRFGQLRAYCLASLLFFLIVQAWLKEKRIFIFVGAFFFSLAYHAFYMLIALGFFMIMIGFIYEKNNRKIALDFSSLSIGFILGILINPYFPSTLVQSLQIFNVAIFANKLSAEYGLRFGGEIYPFGAIQFCIFFAPWLCLLFFIGYQYQKNNLWKNKVNVSVYVLNFILLILLYFSPRILEFLLPILVLLILQVYSLNKKHFYITAIALFVHALILNGLFFTSNESIQAPTTEQFSPIVEKIKNEKDIRIFHSSWGHSPYLIYLLPQAKVVDALDPTYLYNRRPDLLKVQFDLMNGLLKNPVEVIKKDFNSNYALIEPSMLSKTLLHSSEVTLVSYHLGLFLFKLN